MYGGIADDLESPVLACPSVFSGVKLRKSLQRLSRIHEQTTEQSIEAMWVFNTEITNGHNACTEVGLESFRSV